MPAPRTTAEDRAVARIIGSNIRLRRKLLGLTLGELAAHLGLTFQQVQKYERGDNRVAAPILLRIASALNTTTDALYESVGPPATATVVSGDQEPLTAVANFLALDGGLDLARTFAGMSPAQRRALLATARALAKHSLEDA